MRKLFRQGRLFQAAVALSLLLLLAALGGCFFPQHVLTVDSGPVTADAMVVLGGYLKERPERAAELFKQGEAPEILVSGFGDCLFNESLLETNGVPAADIKLEAESRTTRENAKFSIALLRKMRAKCVIIVTSWYHSRRALACFEHYAPEIKFYSRPSYFGYPQGANAETLKPEMSEVNKATPHPTLSPSEAERVRAARKQEWKQVRGYTDSEYWKLLGYWVCYGVCPF